MCLAALVVVIAVLYEVQKWPSTIVSDIAAVWEAEIDLPTDGPARILVG